MVTPAGYMFQPKDEEVITFLNMKMLDPDFSVQTINEVEIYNFEPFDLHRLSVIQSDELVWYFFCAPYYKYANSKGANRRTNTGFWKIIGKGCKIFAKSSKDVVGSKTFFAFCQHGDASKKHKAEWVMQEFRSHYNPPNKNDFVICPIQRKSNNKPKNFSRVETQQLPVHFHMTHDFRNHVAENRCLRVEPRQLHFPSRNHVAEKTIQGVEHEELAYMTSICRNHVAENSFSMVESQLPSQYLTSNCGNPAAENILARVECQHLPGHFFNLTSDYRNHLAEKKFPRDESQPLPSHPLASHSRNHVAENTSPWLESQLPSHHLMCDFRDQVAEHILSGGESLLLAQFDEFYLRSDLNYNSLPALQSPINVEDVELTGSSDLDHNSTVALEDVELSGSNDQDHNSFSAPQLPINPEQISSSYSDVVNDCNVINFQFDSEQEDMNSQLAFQDVYPIEETGDNLPPCFNSSKSITDVHLGDSSGRDIETVDAWIDGYSPIAVGDYLLW